MSRKNPFSVHNLLRGRSQVAGQLGSTDDSRGWRLDTGITDHPKPLTLPVWQRLFILALLCSLHVASASDFWSMGYFDNWSHNHWRSNPSNPPYSDIDWAALTHVSQMCVSVNADGSLNLTDHWGPQPDLIAAAHAHNVKTLLNIYPSSGMQPAIANNLSTMVKNLVGLMNSYGYDGIDVDWEAPETWDASAIMSLFTALRAAVGSSKLLSMDWDRHAYWEITPTFVANMDRFNMMIYDADPTSAPYTWFNAPLYSTGDPNQWSTDLAVHRLVDIQGVSPAKLNVGIPFYASVWSGGGTPYLSGPRQAWDSPKASRTHQNQSYIAANYDLSGTVWDDVAHAPYLRISNGFLTFDNVRSVTEKVNYAKAHNLGGLFIYMGDDYMANQTPKHPLLDAVKQAAGLGGSSNACDLNNDGTVSVVDVQLAVNMDLGLSPCTANVNSTGVCDIIVVQRLINVVLGGTCGVSSSN